MGSDARRWHATAMNGTADGWLSAAGWRLTPWILVIVAIGASLQIGAAIGNPTPVSVLLGGACVYLIVQVATLLWPIGAYYLLAGALFFLVVWAINDDQYFNFFDLFLPSLFLVSVLGAARRTAAAERAGFTGPGHEALSNNTRRFERTAIVFYSLAILSVIQLAVRISPLVAKQMVFFEVRMMYGVFMFPLTLWWVRSERHIQRTIAAVVAAEGLFSLINLIEVYRMHAPRAGMTFVVNRPWFTEGPNEAGAGLSIVCALLAARHRVRPSLWTYPMFGLALVMLALTQSRSGQLTMLVFLLLSLRVLPWRQIAAFAGLTATAALIMPSGAKEKILDTLAFKRGSFEVYTIVIRLYGYVTTWRVFLDHWMFGVGLLGARFMSHEYNSMRITMLGAENYFLEVAASLGVVGFSVLVYLYVQLYRIGRTVQKNAPPGTMAHAMARLHVPLITGLSVANLTGDNFIGFTGIGQVALWCALLIRAGHLAIEEGGPPASEPVAPRPD